MFYYAKKVIYLSVYEKEQKQNSGGFAKIWGNEKSIHLSVTIKNAGSKMEGTYPVFLISAGGSKKKLGEVKLINGSGSWEKDFPADGSEMESLYIELPGGLSVRGGLLGLWENTGKEREQEENAGEKNTVRQEENTGEKNRVHQEETGEIREENSREGKGRNESREEADKKENSRGEQAHKEINIAEISSNRKESPGEDWFKNQAWEEAGVYGSDKWEQLLEQYENVHPFGDERVFISLEPKDFVILQEKYQKLVNNSFLLHGYYNYRHIILGKDGKIGNSLETCFYVGVPGVYYEREKMVAVMFGFEGFECQGPVEIGKFGYYLRQVEI